MMGWLIVWMTLNALFVVRPTNAVYGNRSRKARQSPSIVAKPLSFSRNGGDRLAINTDRGISGSQVDLDDVTLRTAAWSLEAGALHGRHEPTMQ